jgi:prepilin-type N-terminal cleavage/methylation domain-containing protein
MPSHANRGFTILEAVVALAIVGLAGVAALEAVGGELRAADHARGAYTVAALAQDRLVAVALLAAGDLNPLPDSVARGTFAPPFAAYRWTAAARPVMGERDLYDVSVDVTSDAGRLTVATRLYRSQPLGARP